MKSLLLMLPALTFTMNEWCLLSGCSWLLMASSQNDGTGIPCVPVTVEIQATPIKRCGSYYLHCRSFKASHSKVAME